jgi:hypothetical protein
MESAAYHWFYMQKHFSKETMDKYAEQFEKILTENTKFKETLDILIKIGETKGKRNNSGSEGFFSMSKIKTFLMYGVGIAMASWFYFRSMRPKQVEEEVF